MVSFTSRIHWDHFNTVQRNRNFDITQCVSRHRAVCVGRGPEHCFAFVPSISIPSLYHHFTRSYNYSIYIIYNMIIIIYIYILYILTASFLSRLWTSPTAPPTSSVPSYSCAARRSHVHSQELAPSVSCCLVLNKIPWFLWISYGLLLIFRFPIVFFGMCWPLFSMISCGFLWCSMIFGGFQPKKTWKIYGNLVDFTAWNVDIHHKSKEFREFIAYIYNPARLRYKSPNMGISLPGIGVSSEQQHRIEEFCSKNEDLDKQQKWKYLQTLGFQNQWERETVKCQAIGDTVRGRSLNRWTGFTEWSGWSKRTEGMSPGVLFLW